MVVPALRVAPPVTVTVPVPFRPMTRPEVVWNNDVVPSTVRAPLLPTDYPKVADDTTAAPPLVIAIVPVPLSPIPMNRIAFLRTFHP